MAPEYFRFDFLDDGGTLLAQVVSTSSATLINGPQRIAIVSHGRSSRR